MENFRKHDIEVNKDKPFENDKLDRKKQIENLTHLINNVEKQFVLCVNGPWGSGKTTFIKMWQYYLENEGYSTIYFNAWENDFAEDPLIPIVNEFVNTVNNDLPDKFITASKNLLKAIVPAVAKIATAGIIDSKKIQDSMGENVEDVISDLTNKFIDDKFKEHRNVKKNIDMFKKELSKFVKNKINKNDNADEENTENSKCKLIFFIDELDRCKPTFAINLLERIKHVFGIDEVTYILSIDKEQLGKTLSCIYGNGFDVDGYLARFFDLEYMLPDKSQDYLDYLQKNIEVFDTYRINEYSSIIKMFIKLPLRQMQKWNYRLKLSLEMLTGDECQSGGHFLLIILLLIREIDNILYKKILTENYSDDEILEFIKKHSDFNVISKSSMDYISFYDFGLLLGSLQKALLSEDQCKLIETEIKEKSKLLDTNLRDEHDYLGGIEEIMENSFYLKNRKKLLKNIINKIELSYNFNFKQ